MRLLLSAITLLLPAWLKGNKRTRQDRNMGISKKHFNIFKIFLIGGLIMTACKPLPNDDDVNCNREVGYSKDIVAGARAQQLDTTKLIMLDSVGVVEHRISGLIEAYVLSFFENEDKVIDDHVLIVETTKEEKGYEVFLSVQSRNDLSLHDVIGYFKIDSLICIVEGKGDGYAFPKIKTKALNLDYKVTPKSRYSEKFIADWYYVFVNDTMYYYPDIH